MLDYQSARALRRYWWAGAMILGLVLISTAAFTYRENEVYSSSTTVVVRPATHVGEIDEILDTLATLDRRSVLATYSEIISSKSLLEQAKNDLGLSQSDGKYSLRSSVVPDTNILRILIEGKDPETCASLANAVARVAGDYSKQFFGIYELKILDPAIAPLRPIRPSFGRNMSVAICVGIFLGLLSTFALDFASKKLVHAQVG